MADSSSARACSECFTDEGLRLAAQGCGIIDDSACPECASTNGHKLTDESLGELAHRFFVWGTLHRVRYGAAPILQFNDRQKTSITAPPWLERDVRLVERILGVGFFHYGPRMWMVGEVEPLLELEAPSSRPQIVQRILTEYPRVRVGTGERLYRIRKDPKTPEDGREYDSPPAALAGTGRFDSPGLPVLYASQDLQVCVHECRVIAEDDLYVGTLAPIRDLNLLDISALLPEEHVTEFESLDMAVHMLFLAGQHSYDIARDIARAAHAAGLDGVAYPSYFSLLRTGGMPFETTLGISHRRFWQLHGRERAKIVPNLGLFGRPVEDGKVRVQCINRLVLSRVEYAFQFGPVGYK